MKINDDAKLFIWWDAVLTFDPAAATAVELEVDGTRYPMAWTNTAVWDETPTPDAPNGRWARTARTASMFIGTGRTAGGSDVQLPKGHYMAEPIVTSADGQVIPIAHPFPLDVN